MFKKVIGIVISASVAVGVLPTVGYAAEYSSDTVSPDAYANDALFYYQGSGGGITNSHAISAEDFMAEGIWKNQWSDISSWTDGYEENILSFNGIDYKIRVTLSDINSVSAGFTSQNAAAGAVLYTSIDVPDGNYSGISLLGGGENANSSGLGLLRFVYSDGPGEWIEFEQSKVTAQGDNALSVKAKKISGSSVTDGNDILLHQINVEGADIDKVVTSVDIAARNCKFNAQNELERVSFGAAAYRYASKYVAMTMIADARTLENKKIESIKVITDMLPAIDSFEFTEENIEKLEEIKSIRETVNDEIVTDSYYIGILETADSYIELLGQISIQLNNRLIEEIGQKLELLPSVEDFEINDETLSLMEEINGMYENVDLTLDITEENLLILDKLDEYNQKLDSLKQEINDAVMLDVIEIINTLPAIEEFEYKETYTDDVIAVLYELDRILAEIDDEAGVSDEYQDAYESAKAYADKKDYKNVLINNELLAEISDLIETLPVVDEMEFSRVNESVILKIKTRLDEIITEYLTDEQRSVSENAQEYIALLEQFPPISVALEPESFINYARVYIAGSSGVAYDAYAVDGEGIMALDIWEKPWNVEGNVGDNTLIHDGVSFDIRVITERKQLNAIFQAPATTSIGGATAVDIDVNDGKYIGMSFLGGTAHAGSRGGVRFNYSDGTDSGFMYQSVKRMITADSNSIAIPAEQNGEKVDTLLYLHKYDFENPYPEKTVVSVSLPCRNVSITDGVAKDEADSGGTGYVYWVNWFGMSMLQETTDYISALSDRFNMLPDSAEISDSLIEQINGIDSFVSQAIAMGVDLSEVQGYDKYLKVGSKLPRILTYIKSADLKNAKVEIEFGADVNISDADIAVIDENGNEIAFDFEYSNKKGTVTIKNDFDYDKLYTLTVKKSVSAIAEPSNVLGTDNQYQFKIPCVAGFESFDVADMGETVEVSFTFANHIEETTDAMISVCLIDENGRIYDSAIVVEKDVLKGEEFSKDISLKYTDNYELKVFILDGIGFMNTIAKY